MDFAAKEVLMSGNPGHGPDDGDRGEALAGEGGDNLEAGLEFLATDLGLSDLVIELFHAFFRGGQCCW